MYFPPSFASLLNVFLDDKKIDNHYVNKKKRYIHDVFSKSSEDQFFTSFTSNNSSYHSILATEYFRSPHHISSQPYQDTCSAELFYILVIHKS